MNSDHETRLVDSPVSRYEFYINCLCDNKVGGTVPRDETFEFICVKCGKCWLGSIHARVIVKAPILLVS